jgi:hypothetical protein
MRRSVLVLSAVAIAACRSPGEPVDQLSAVEDPVFAELRSRGDQTFVLTSAEQQGAAPIVTVDLQCAAGRYQHQVRDSLMLRGDGTARRAIVFEQLTDGRVSNSSHMTASGTWRPFNAPSFWWYYGEAPSVELTLKLDSGLGSPYTMYLRTRGANTLTSMMPMGGSCPGFTDKARHAEFTFLRN